MRVFALALLLAAGCGTNVENAAGRRVSARETCYNVGQEDGFIDLIFDALRVDRDAGFTELEHFPHSSSGDKRDMRALRLSISGG